MYLFVAQITSFIATEWRVLNAKRNDKANNDEEFPVDCECECEYECLPLYVSILHSHICLIKFRCRNP